MLSSVVVAAVRLHPPDHPAPGSNVPSITGHQKRVVEADEGPRSGVAIIAGAEHWIGGAEFSAVGVVPRLAIGGVDPSVEILVGGNDSAIALHPGERSVHVVGDPG